MQKESVVVFDEAHNIDNVCIEALSVSVRRQTIDGARRNISRMRQEIDKYVRFLAFSSCFICFTFFTDKFNSRMYNLLKLNHLGV